MAEPIYKERTMYDNLLLIEEINGVINKKLADCECHSCTCSEVTKDEYFQELKNILTKYNKEYIHLNNISIYFFDRSAIQFHY